MKKVVKWTVYALILLGVIALTICYLVIPENTQLFVDKVIEYANTPVGIAGFSTTIGGIFIFIIAKYILSTTKFGKKQLEKMEDKLQKTEEVMLSKVEEIKNFKESIKEDIENIKTSCDSQITIVYEQFENLQKSTIESLKLIPNKKVQELVAKYENEFEQNKQEIIDKTINSNKVIDEKIAEIERKYNEFIENVEKALNEEAKNN